MHKLCYLMTKLAILSIIFILSSVFMNPAYSILQSRQNDKSIFSEKKLFTSQITIEGGTLILNSSTIEMKIEFDSGSYISSIRNSLTSKEIKLELENYYSFWNFMLLDGRSFNANSASSYDCSIISSTKAEIEYQVLVDSEYMQVVITFQVDEPHPGVNFKMEIIASENHPSIANATLPIIAGIKGWGDNPGSEQVAIPELSGYLIENAVENILEYSFYSEYPGLMSMQFMVLLETNVGGFVISTLDARSRHKCFAIENDGTDRDLIHLVILHSADNMRFEKSNNFTMDYWAVIQGYKGNSWGEGAELYKNWAVNQWYVEKGPVITRTDIPTWLKELDYDWRGNSYSTDWGTGEIELVGTTVDKMGDLFDYLTSYGLSSNMLIDWWGWSRDGFDKGLPEYYPPRDGEEALLYGINDAQNKSAKVELYFNGRLVDINTDTFTNYSQYLTGYYDDIYLETYGIPLTAAVADPSSTWWQDLMLNLTKRAVEYYGVNGVYFDQIASSQPMFDYRNVTSHPPGGGSWWQEAVNALLFRVRQELRVINESVIMSSENILETNLRYLDTSYIFQLNKDFTEPEFASFGKTIPLFSFVYLKYFLQSGQSDISPDSKFAFIWAISEMLLRGYNLGGIGVPNIGFTDPNPNSIVSKAYKMRKVDNYSFFRDGELLYPYNWKGVPNISLRNGYVVAEVPAGAIQGYKNNQGDIAILVVNRGTASLEWNGNFKEILEESGITIPEHAKADVTIYKNGDIIEVDEMQLESDFSYTIPVSTFILFKITNITEYEPTVETEESIFFSILTLPIIIIVYLLRRKKLKI